MARAIDSEHLKDRLSKIPLSEWLKIEIERQIDAEQTIGEEPEILWQSLIPLNPRTKKNNQKIVINRKTKTPMIMQGDSYKQYEKDAGWFLKAPEKPIDEPVTVKCIFYRESARRCDLTNLLEAIDDILVKHKIIADDDFKILVSHDGSRVTVDRENPRTEITIYRY